jgi:hypothetical protein
MHPLSAYPHLPAIISNCAIACRDDSCQSVWCIDILSGLQPEEVPMGGSDNVLRDRDKTLRDRDRDKALTDGLAKALLSNPAPRPKPARLRTIGVFGNWISAKAKTAYRKVVAAFGAVVGLLRDLMWWTAVAILVAGAALFAWSQSADTETRQVSSDLLNRFNADEMWKARLTLERYYYLLSGDKTAPADLAKQTEEYFRSFVYQKAVPAAGRLADRIKFGSDREKQEEFLRQVDQSRRRVKNFYEDIIVFSEGKLITNAFKEKVLKGRFYRNTGDFLECYWLPVELGQNAALYQGRKADNDKRACQVVDWYREKFPVAGRSFTPCVAYAPRQPDYCVDPKAEPLPSE